MISVPLKMLFATYYVSCFCWSSVAISLGVSSMLVDNIYDNNMTSVEDPYWFHSAFVCHHVSLHVRYCVPSVSRLSLVYVPVSMLVILLSAVILLVDPAAVPLSGYSDRCCVCV